MILIAALAVASLLCGLADLWLQNKAVKNLLSKKPTKIKWTP
jgi:hypothetical protein